MAVPNADTVRDHEPSALAGNGPTPPAWWPNRADGRFVSAGSRRWYLQDRGDGPVVLLLHGTGAACHSWRHWLPLIAAEHRVLAPDLPGHGFSERRPREALSLTAMSDALSELLLALDVRPDLIIGHSAGAAIAVELALAGGAGTGVVGVNAALLPFGGAFQPLISPIARWFAASDAVAAQIARKARDERAVRRVLEGTGSVIDATGLRCYQHCLSSERHVGSVLSMMGHWQLGDLLERMAALQTPPVLATATRDTTVSPSQATRVLSKVPSAELVSLGAYGHLAHEEAASATFARIRRFLPVGDATPAAAL